MAAAGEAIMHGNVVIGDQSFPSLSCTMAVRMASPGMDWKPSYHIMGRLIPSQASERLGPKKPTAKVERFSKRILDASMEMGPREKC